MQELNNYILNLTYVITGIVMFLIGISAALWGQNTASRCNSLTGAVTQLLSNDRSHCQYTDAAIGIGIVFLVIGVILGIGGAKSKEHEEQTIY
jgi:ABC-type phosphate transport system permease subunit